MSIVGACMVPHPPIILPEVGRGEEKKIAATYRAYERAAEFVAETKPETIIVTSPHVILYSDWFHISPGKRASGDMRRFGAPGTKLQVTYDTELRDVICRNAHAMDFPAGTLGEREAQLDHATFIPLWFIDVATYGYDPINPLVYAGGCAIIGAVIGVIVRSKDAQENADVNVPALISSIFGVNEPALYAILIPRKKLMWATFISAGIGGAIAGLAGAKLYSFGASGPLGFPSFINPAGIDAGFVGLIISGVVALVCAFAAALVIGSAKDAGSKGFTLKVE